MPATGISGVFVKQGTSERKPEIPKLRLLQPPRPASRGYSLRGEGK
jgi:hypothetical protein